MLLLLLPRLLGWKPQLLLMMPPPLLCSWLKLWLLEVLTSVSVRVDVGGGENGVLRGCAADAPTVAAMVGVVPAVVFIVSCEAPPQSCCVDFQQNINQYFVFGFARRHNNHGSTPPTCGRLRAPTIQAGPRISADLHSATPQRA